MKSIAGFLIAAFAIVLAISALLDVKSLPLWIFIIAMLIFGGSKRKK